jgi:hypothetical protein
MMLCLFSGTGQEICRPLAIPASAMPSQQRAALEEPPSEPSSSLPDLRIPIPPPATAMPWQEVPWPAQPSAHPEPRPPCGSESPSSRIGGLLAMFRSPRITPEPSPRASPGLGGPRGPTGHDEEEGGEAGQPAGHHRTRSAAPLLPLEHVDSLQAPKEQQAATRGAADGAGAKVSGAASQGLIGAFGAGGKRRSHFCTLLNLLLCLTGNMVGHGHSTALPGFACTSYAKLLLCLRCLVHGFSSVGPCQPGPRC